MPRFPISKAPEAISRLAPDMQALPLLVNSLFAPLILANGYKGYYKQPKIGGHQYFIFNGYGKLNNGYRIEIVMYYDELDITVTKPIGIRHRLLRAAGYTLQFIVAGVLIIVSVESACMNSTGTGKTSDKPSKKRWDANSFKAHEVAELIGATAAPAFTYDVDTAEKVVTDYYAYFKKNLLSVIRGEQWIHGLPKVNLYGN